MIINSSAVRMAAQTKQSVSFKKTQNVMMTNLSTGSRSYSQSFYENVYESSSQNQDMSQQPESPGYTFVPSGINRIDFPRQKDSTADLIAQLRHFLIDFRKKLDMMLGRNTLIGVYASDNGQTIDLSTTDNATVWNKVAYSSSTYEEAQSLDFETVGSVVTADGRTIDFNMQLSMSREYVESVDSLTNETMVIMTDPTVISLDSDPVAVSDQKWQFDIDGDGKLDGISLLSKGQGFLVYDKNEDGIINNGLEMFGAATGNGFEELAAYDEDGNGWIDENDSIYKKLAVWVKDDSGNDKLLSLSEANVGAMYLGSRAADYSLKSDVDNSYNAEVRRMGMYLSEDGVAKSMSQLDMVKALVS